MPRPRTSAGSSPWVFVGILVAAWHPAVPAAAATFSEEELEQIVAPIALYPDPLLAQVFMASTYPLEVVEAARFQKEHPELEDDALDKALQDETWDASVKSLLSFPEVLTMMNEKLDWTQKLGDAFLAQQSAVMDSVQRLRARAKAEGNLETTEQQKVVVEPAPPPPPDVVVEAPPSQTIIKIEPANPQVVYVPTYNPTVVYGPWPYPAYPPYYYYPPGYVAGASLISFGIGMAVGASLWGNCGWGWGHGDVDIDVNRNANFNRNTERNFNRNEFNNKFQDGKWKHDASHRKGVQYRDKATQQRFGKDGPKGADSREAFRGRAEQGREQMKREGTAGVQRDLARNQAGAAGDRAGGQQRPGASGDRAGGQQRPGAAGDRAGAKQPSAGSRDRAATPQRSASTRPSSANRGSGAFQGVGNGRQVRQDSSRGRSSRASSASMGGHRGGGSRGGGGRPRR
jgi:hypothetical protein